jgi:hypothetical protein
MKEYGTGLLMFCENLVPVACHTVWAPEQGCSPSCVRPERISNTVHFWTKGNLMSKILISYLSSSLKEMYLLQINIIIIVIIISIDLLCGLVIIVPGYRSRGPGFDCRR